VNAGDLTFLYPDQPRHPRQKYMAAAVEVDLSAPDEISLEVPESFLPPAARPDLRPESPLRPEQAARGPRTPYTPPTPEGSALPNQAVNLFYAAAVGIALGYTNPVMWWAIAIGASFLLSLWHKLAGSRQYYQFGTLDSYPSDGAFILLKSLVTFIEVLLVFLATRAIVGA
jgi:hypothetical protein